ncbi:hypothetical protein RU86_GL001058 [Lactococcus piscium]|uniref:Uncharacterized protein n=1 Tax=Pseudolactococcus piscium TaxID=1364 RepID=A0A2A5S5D5_9LACT|nr:hypothetical protein RU86_GL001058 [Lactococcus piscium]
MTFFDGKNNVAKGLASRLLIEKSQKSNKLRASYISCLALLNGHFLTDCHFLCKF